MPTAHNTKWKEYPIHPIRNEIPQNPESRAPPAATEPHSTDGMSDARVLATDRVSRRGVVVGEGEGRGRGGAHGKGVVGVVAHELLELLLDAVLQHRHPVAGEVRLERPILAAVHGGTLAPPPLPPQPQPPQFETANVAAPYGYGAEAAGREGVGGYGGEGRHPNASGVGFWTLLWSLDRRGDGRLCGAAVRVWGETGGCLLCWGSLVRFWAWSLDELMRRTRVRRHPGGSGRGPAGQRAPPVW